VLACLSVCMWTKTPPPTELQIPATVTTLVCSMVEMICSWCHCNSIISCFIKLQKSFAFLMPAYPGCSEKEVVKQVSISMFRWTSWELPVAQHARHDILSEKTRTPWKKYNIKLSCLDRHHRRGGQLDRQRQKYDGINTACTPHSIVKVDWFTTTTITISLQWPFIFQVNVGQPVPPQLLLHLFQNRTSGDKRNGFLLWYGWPYCHSSINIKTLKRTQGTNPNQWLDLILYFIHHWMPVPVLKTKLV